MRLNKIRIVFGLFLLIVLIGCKKECIYGKLVEIECSDGFYLMEDAYLENMVYHEGYMGGKQYVITNKKQLDTLELGSLWQNVDFDLYDIIGVDHMTSMARSCKRQQWVCKSNSGKVIRLNGEFALIDRCQQSGTYSIPLSFWAKIPKLTEEQSVEFVVRMSQ